MVSKRIKYARAHLSRKRHQAILATPLWRRVTKTDFNTLPRPYSVARAALRARCTKRIKMMAQPKVVQRRYDRGGSRSALVHARMFGLAFGNRNMLARINSLLRGIRKSRYQKYRIICNSLQQRAANRERKIRRKLHRALTKPSDWERHNIVLLKLAAPKRVHKPRRPSWMTGKKQLFTPQYADQLARPVQRAEPYQPDPFRVQKSALTYNITERMISLSTRENPRPEPEYRIPGFVEPEALKAFASQRVQELARPAVRQPGKETNLREDAFSVSPMALKAVCRPRIKVLAQPKGMKKK